MGGSSPGGCGNEQCSGHTPTLTEASTTTELGNGLRSQLQHPCLQAGPGNTCSWAGLRLSWRLPAYYTDQGTEASGFSEALEEELTVGSRPG